MLSGVWAPTQASEVEVPRIAIEVAQLNEDTVRHMAEPKDSDVRTPALRAKGAHIVPGLGLRQAEPND